MSPAIRAAAWLAHRTGLLRLIHRVASRSAPPRNSGGKIVAPWIRVRRSNSLQILTYHRVNDDGDIFFAGLPTDAFRRQMRYLARNYEVLPLEEAVDALRSGTLPRSAASITFDDGYRDNYTNAFPILRELGLPATIFLATDMIGTGRLLWHETVFEALRSTREQSMNLEFGELGHCALDSTPSRRLAKKRIVTHLKTLDPATRQACILELHEKLGVPMPGRSDGLMLDWDEVREMGSGGVSFGAHTCSHPILSRLDAETARAEIVGSRDAIESRLGTSVRTFAYPNGTRQDFNEQTKSILRDAGFTVSVTTLFGASTAEDDPLELRRIGLWERTEASFGLKMSWYKFAG